MTSEPRATFSLIIQGKPGQAGIHSLRTMLKRLLRQHGFRARQHRHANTTSPQPSTIHTAP
jgi:hypothetical protein